MSAIDVRRAREQLLSGPDALPFTMAEVEALDEPVRRYFSAAIVPGTPVATSATLRMRGHIKVQRWLPFRADQVLAPRRGFVWRARAAGLISGFDAYVDGDGAMQWKLLGLAPVMRAEGPDIARSAAGRCAGEGLWLPTASLPRFGVQWSAVDDAHIVAALDLDRTHVELHCRLHADGNLRSVMFDRWGDPDSTGTFGWHPFGGDITEHATFSGLTIPSAGRWGWHYGTARWEEGEFFRCRITAHQPTTIPSSG